MESDTDKVLKRVAATKKQMAESVCISTIGEHVIDVLKRGEELSVESLLASLQRDIDSSRSARGEGVRAQDLRRLTAEAAINHLRDASGVNPEDGS